jgi:hypothetical protein
MVFTLLSLSRYFASAAFRIGVSSGTAGDPVSMASTAVDESAAAMEAACAAAGAVDAAATIAAETRAEETGVAPLFLFFLLSGERETFNPSCSAGAGD